MQNAATGTVRTGYVRALLDYLENHQLDTAAVFTPQLRNQLDDGSLNERISGVLWGELLAKAIAVSADPCLPLHLAEELIPKHWGVFAYAAMTCKNLGEVSAMLVRYEDKRFWQHAGVDPLALLRAAGQALLNGRAVSGGSTLTMQVARLLEDGSTGRWAGKLRQIRVQLDQIAAELLRAIAPFHVSDDVEQRLAHSQEAATLVIDDLELALSRHRFGAVLAALVL